MKNNLQKSVFFQIAFIVAILFITLTASAVTKTSTGTGNWNTGATWTPAGVPAAGDDVVIAATHVVTIDITTNNILSLTISGTVTIGNDNNNRIVTVTGNITINSGGVFQSAGNGQNSLNIGGNLANAGTFNMNDGTAATADADVTFDGTANQTVSGAGATTDFNLVTINNTGATNNVNNIVEITSTNFTTPIDFLALTDGTFKLSIAATLDLSAGALNLTAPDGFVINNAGAVVNFGGNNFTVTNGIFELLAGTVNIGNGNNLFGVSGGTVTLSGGTVNVLGRFQMSGGTTTINGASINIDPQATASVSSGIDIFDATGVSSVLFTSGTVTIIDPHATNGTGNAVQIVAGGGTKDFTGSTIRLGDGTSTTAGSADGFDINAGTTTILGNLVINNPSGTNRFARLVTNNYEASGNITITAGELRSNAFDIALAGNWTNNGIFTQGADLVTFNGTAAQTIGGTASTTFNNITFNNTLAGIAITIATGATIAGIATFTDGIVSTSNTNFLSFNDGATAVGAGLNQATDASYVAGPVLKTGNDAFTFPIGSTGSGGYMPLSITAPDDVADAFKAEYTRNNATALGSVTTPILNVSRCDYWNLTETNDAGAATSISVTLSWDNGSPCNAASFVTQPSSLTIGNFNGTNWVQSGTGGSFTGTATTGTVTRTAVTIFSPIPFSLANTANNQNPLPVTFSDVKAFEKGAGVQIEWTNQTEKDVLNYVIERSTNGRDFTAIGQLGSRSNQSDKQSYLSFDGAPFPGTNFYRIKVVEIDGKVIYSKLLKVDIGKIIKGIVLYPNPAIAGSAVSISFTAIKGQYTLKLLNSAGQQVYTKVLTHSGGSVSQSVELPSSLKTGVYNLMITGDNYRESKMFIMQ
jgi:G8 domain